ncbi:hypothetical protein ACH4NS_11820 [Streptomyces mutabilis]|uniref:hypothetical protein n=1 Tax=Streptomyces mutabilis TaxID=67332 RepID=UPI000A2400DD|nr:hypothetical protein [Streptomyces sp. Alain-F2R5]MDG9691297.1 hypothetical protein [Streptomyces sp. DH17]OSC70046.1 hypothetical protein B5181_10845 [Streptomyces sp. 4F]PAN00384.1 hypothetical protein CJI59_17320 [Streptomyces sp. Alain-F2R5]
MPDRSLRLLTLPQQSAQPGERSTVLLRERPSSPPDSPSDRRDGGGQDGADDKKTDRDNPFAPPPEGTPDSPWQPRHPSGDGDGQGSSGPQGGGGRSPWGGQWSDRQPGRSSGGFGERPGGAGSGPEGPGGGTGPRWDPTDPAQRRARYALLSGMWALFFALFTWPYVALLLGALALYWGISALRTKPRAASDPDTPARPADQTGRPQRTAAISGLVTSSLAILLVAASFGAQLVYSDYYTCRNDALTNEAKQACDRHLPEQLRDLLGTEG